MSSGTQPATGGQIACQALAMLGAETIFSVSGNQVLPVYDAAADAGLRIIHMRHESAAAYAAAAHAELTGRPGVLLSSAGPGFLAAFQGVAAAATMELPLLFLSGASPVSQRGGGAFQDLDQERIADAVCKRSFQVRAPERIGQVVGEAWQLALAGIPGPVHVGLPADVLLAESAITGMLPSTPIAAGMSDAERDVLDAIARRLEQAKRPLILARPAAARGEAGATLHRLARSLGIGPVIIEAPRGLSDLKYLDITGKFPDSDCVLAIAPADFAVGFLDPAKVATSGDVLLIDAPSDPAPRRAPLHQARIAPATALAYLVERVAGNQVEPGWSALWPVSPPTGEPEQPEDDIHPLAVALAVREALRPDDVVVLDGGEFCQWVRFGLRDVSNPVLWNGKIGAIGGSLPMAIGAATLDRPGRVIAIMGDGAAGYHLSEFETAARYGLSFTAIIGNDARWAAEWHMQAARYGSERTFETELLPARYDRVAAGFDASGEEITDAADLPAALHEALGRSGASCLNVRIASVRSPAEVE